MGVTIKGQAAVMKAVAEATRIVQEEFMRTLSYLGEQTVVIAKDRPQEASWFDHTGNLRSSIGYAVLKNGQKMIEGSFKKIKDGSLGVQMGEDLIDALASAFTDRYTLLVVAGMNYAETVEAIEGKDVLKAAELHARQKIGEYIRLTEQRIQQRIDRL